MTVAAFFTVVLIHLAAAISPGPAFVVSVQTAARDGFRVATGLALGFGLGAVLWATAAMAGLAVLFRLVPELFLILKVAGGCFLIWIAIQMWRHADEPLTLPSEDKSPRSLSRAVWFGLFTFASNPKAAVFFGAVFVGLVPATTPLPVLAALLMFIFVNEFLWYVIVARLFSAPRVRAAYIRLKAPVDRVFGTFIAVFGAKIATS
jgi:threonine/homoserine/homoserine lactone efflux protein